MHVKKGDNVLVIAGQDKGKQGKVLRSIPREDRVVVEGVNMAKRRIRPRRQGEQGQTIAKALPIHVSNVKKVG